MSARFTAFLIEYPMPFAIFGYDSVILIDCIRLDPKGSSSLLYLNLATNFNAVIFTINTVITGTRLGLLVMVMVAATTITRFTIPIFVLVLASITDIRLGLLGSLFVKPYHHSTLTA